MIAFLAAAGTAHALGLVPWWLLGAYGLMSALTFVVYAADKRAARRARRRVPEATLLNLGLLCGWPGAVVAQQVLRHKTIKQSFRRSFWQSVVVNVVVVAFVVSPLAGQAVHNVLEITGIAGP